jgi:tyrosine-protein kinase Etk/Wzc
MDKHTSLEQERIGITETKDAEPKALGETLLDFFSLVTKWRKLLVWFVLACTVLAGGFAAISPKWYKSTATVFPAEETSIFPGLEGLSGLTSVLGAGRALSSLTGRGTELDRYMAILKSETALMKVIERFDLTKVYEITSYPREKTMKALLSNTEFEIADEGNLAITVYDKDPQRAADMANYFVEVLNEINSRMQATNAKANREFIEQRVEKCQNDLRAAEDTLKEFQQASGMIIVPDQSSSSISAVAELYATKARKEVEAGILQRTVGPENPLYRQTQVELEQISKKVSEIPALGIGSLRLYRDVAIQQKILEFILPLYEQAKMEEKRSTPTVIVLDHAQVAERKAKPKILLYALLAFVASIVLTVFIIFLREGVGRLRAVQPERFDQIWKTVRSDWFGLRWKGNARK